VKHTDNVFPWLRGRFVFGESGKLRGGKLVKLQTGQTTNMGREERGSGFRQPRQRVKGGKREMQRGCYVKSVRGNQTGRVSAEM